ncbi:hypothetical protein B296_00032183 [Ensete ventricosum]|uniref:3-beta hydroxysteroid dehydrogenase/isomerase domain-containing protein n=1 Tax=Ensete ventricosum TaxID=4639 RepID=A0A426Z875_ENSVE|nr:hypothetical protein B296_00032183 [Ensete ventricosum]
MDKLRETEMFGEVGRDGVWAVMASVMDLEGLCRAFDGCAGVFHTSSVVDPGGLSGYSLDLYLDVLISFVSVPSWESEAFVFVFIGSSSVAFFACETNLCCAPPPVSLTEAHGPNGGESSRAGGRSLREDPIGQKMRLHLLASGLRLAREQHSSK